MRGSSLGFHSDSTGHLFGIAGTKFRDVSIVIRPALTKPIRALESAINGARAQRADIVSLGGLDKEVVARLLNDAKIELASSGDGKTFGFIWTLKVATTRGSLLKVELDAANGEVLSIFDGMAQAECTPETNSHVAVGAESQLPGVFYGALPSTEAPELNSEFPGFTREAHREASPEIIVYMGESPGLGDQCPEGGDQFFRVFPLTSKDQGATWYADWDNEPWRLGEPVRGRSAADAMKHTIQTLDALDHYGWSSYDGHGGTARIAVDSDCSGELNNAYFNFDGLRFDMPNDGVGICKRSTPQDPQFSAALDVVAHEWGHGVIRHSAGWTYTPEGGQLHEGFADMIGYGVEWYTRGAASDWTLGEDAKLLRRVDIDEGVGCYHQCDSAALHASDHRVGNMIGVVFMMMAEGVSNPGDARDCDRSKCKNQNSPLDVCSANVFNLVPAELGTDHAFRFLLNLVLYYSSPSTAWTDLPNLVTVAGKSGPPAKIVKEISIVLPGGGGNPPCVEYNDFQGASSAHTALTGVGYPPAHQLVAECG